MKIVKKNKILLFFTLIPFVSFSQQGDLNNFGKLWVTPNTKMSVIGEIKNKLGATINNDGDLYVYDHYTNEGNVTFSPVIGLTDGVTKMVGFKGVQKILGDSPMFVNNIIWNNNQLQPAFILENNINVFEKSSFEKGIIKIPTDRNSLIFESFAYHENASDNSHVDGYVQKIGNKNEFKFPIGNQTKYVYAVISKGRNDTDSYYGRYNLENSNSIYPHNKKPTNISKIDDKQFWDLKKDVDAADVTIRLSLNKDITPQFINSDPYDEIHIVGWDHVQETWVDFGGRWDSLKNEIISDNSVLGTARVFTFARILDIPEKNYNVKPNQIVTLNGDNKNDVFYITDIEYFPDNNVQIYNRWGVKVFERDGYTNDSDVAFKGFSEGRTTLDSSAGLPEGVYFYVLKYVDKKSKENILKGYFYLKK